jgi:hypothetical protein
MEKKMTELTNEELRKVDISNLLLYARMAKEFKWQTEIIDSGVVIQTLNEIADRLGAAVSAAPQPMCPKCKSPRPCLMRIDATEKEVDHCALVRCYACGTDFKLNGIDDFAQFFAPAPAQDSEK